MNEDFIFVDDELRSYNGTVSTLTIPSDINELPNKLFLKNLYLETVIIPNTVTHIGSGCFKGCKNLKKVVIECDINSLPSSCFKNCISLETIEINGPIRSIGTGCFQNCRSMEILTLPTTIRNIGKRAFYKCTSLTIVNNLNLVATVGDLAFSKTSLESIDLKSIITIGIMAFSDTSITTLTIPYYCKLVGIDAFKNCNLLTSVQIESSMCYLSLNCFSNCASLKTIILDDVTALSGCCSFNSPTLSTIKVTSDCKPFIDFNGLLRSTDVLKYNVYLNVEEDQGVLMITKGSKGTVGISELNRCMRLIKNGKPIDRLENVRFKISISCYRQEMIELDTDFKLMYAYLYCKKSNSLDYYKELLNFNKRVLTSAVVFKMLKKITEEDLRKYLLTFVASDELTHSFTDFDAKHVAEVVSKVKKKKAVVNCIEDVSFSETIPNTKSESNLKPVKFVDDIERKGSYKIIKDIIFIGGSE